MKKFKWPWSGKKKEIKHAPIDLSEFKEELAPWLLAMRGFRASRNILDRSFQQAHRSFWDKIEEIVGYKLPGNWQFNAENHTIIHNNELEGEDVFTPASDQGPSGYEEFWVKMQETFYPPKEI